MPSRKRQKVTIAKLRKLVCRTSGKSTTKKRKKRQQRRRRGRGREMPPYGDSDYVRQYRIASLRNPPVDTPNELKRNADADYLRTIEIKSI